MEFFHGMRTGSVLVQRDGLSMTNIDYESLVGLARDRQRARLDAAFRSRLVRRRRGQASRTCLENDPELTTPPWPAA
jgi:hypothetical protein